MRASRVVLVGAVVMVTACGGSSVKQSGLTATTGLTQPSATGTTTTATVARTTTTAAAATTTTTSASTTTVTPTAAVTANPVDSTDGPSRGPTPSNYTCPDGKPAQSGICGIDDTVPLRPDIDVVIAAYLAFAREDLRISSSPDNPDWDTYLALVDPASRANARSSAQKRIDDGQRLDTSLGVAFHPRSTQATGRPENVELLADCRDDGSYWVVAATSEPIEGAVAQVRKRRLVTQMTRVDGRWYVSSFKEDDRGCQPND